MNHRKERVWGMSHHEKKNPSTGRHYPEKIVRSSSYQSAAVSVPGVLSWEEKKKGGA